MKIDYAAIGRRVREIRLSAGLTQTRLAEIADIEPSNLSHIERAATKVSLPTLIHIANALNVSLDELVYGSLVKSQHISVKIINELLEDCTFAEIRALTEILKTSKNALKGKY